MLICGLALLLLIFITFRIARQISKPLKEFSGYARQIRNGLQSDGISISSNDELGVLKDAFSYLQHNNEKMRNEIRLAQKLQQRFLPYPSPLPENIHVKGELQQSKHVGGDLYEYFLADDHLYFAIGDVAGKGIPAALYMASVVKLFRYVASIQTSTANICNTINIYTAENNEGDMYVTMFVGILNIKTGEMTFTNAGHPEPLIIHANRETSKLTCHHDSPVGLLENYSYSECHYTLPIGTTLLLYTDGITDAENQSGLFYGEEKLKAAIRNSSSLQPNKLVDAILKDLHQHINNAELSDDFTLLAIQLQ
ncbi:SpoIIE family protein phosphatase [Odoribacter lunatus]|uniref:SpoIIE family protein phosphatase n=1 Tax=Odoribacter lunatus TaxID=2941335 RepID=UPI00203F57D1|nr:SpoIIE family protein phosphatase [Odoribacter lunatus]